MLFRFEIDRRMACSMCDVLMTSLRWLSRLPVRLKIDDISAVFVL